MPHESRALHLRVTVAFSLFRPLNPFQPLHPLFSARATGKFDSARDPSHYTGPASGLGLDRARATYTGRHSESRVRAGFFPSLSLHSPLFWLEHYNPGSGLLVRDRRGPRPPPLPCQCRWLSPWLVAGISKLNHLLITSI